MEKERTMTNVIGWNGSSIYMSESLFQSVIRTEKHPVAAPSNGENGEVLVDRASFHPSSLSLDIVSIGRFVLSRPDEKTNEENSKNFHPPRYSVKDKPYPFPLFDFRELPFSDSIPRPRKDYLFTDILRVGALTIGNKLHGELGETETAASYFSGSRRVSNANQSVPVASRTERRGEIGSA